RLEEQAGAQLGERTGPFCMRDFGALLDRSPIPEGVEGERERLDAPPRFGKGRDVARAQLTVGKFLEHGRILLQLAGPQSHCVQSARKTGVPRCLARSPSVASGRHCARGHRSLPCRACGPAESPGGFYTTSWRNCSIETSSRRNAGTDCSRG